MTNREIAAQIAELVGGKPNVIGVTSCATRCRIDVNDTEKVDLKGLKEIEDAQGVVSAGSQIQIVFGPGKCLKVAQEVASVLGIAYDMMEAGDLKKEISAKNQTPFKLMLKKCASIFVPILPAIIACGLLAGVNNILKNFVPGYSSTAFASLLTVIHQTAFTYLPIFVGISAAKVFGGSMFVGGTVAAILQMSSLTGMSAFGIEMQAGRGGVIAVLAVVAFASWVEKKVRKFVPEMIDIFATPLLTVFISGFVGLIVIQPIGGILSDLIVNGINLGLSKGGFLFGFIMSTIWLPLVATGLHHGVTPIKAELLNSLGHVPIQVMCAFVGPGQVGAVLAIYMKTKNQRLKKVIASGIPVQLLGIGEPLIYGVTLPLVKPFICACLCAGVGGGLAAVLGLTSFGYGLSGLLITLQLNKPLLYLGIYLLVIVLSFIVTSIVGFDDIISE